MIWVVIGGVVLSALSWGLVLGLGWPQWVAVLVTLTVLAIVLVVVAFRVLAARRRGAALERELMKQASKQAEQAKPERRHEILALQQQMSEAIRALSRSKLGGRGGKAALYALPWYVFIGPPAAGKTTALERSGLAFTSSQGGRRHKVQGVAGTRNCDWWFSEEAILLDTAGRFTTEDNDEPEWLAFLDLLKRFRPKRPLDGLIVAISCTDLLGTNAEQIDETAKKLRARLDELIRRLEMVLPVYVLITKADLISGFVEFWGDLPAASRGQVWGATFDPDAEELAEPAAAVKAEFDILTQTLHARTLERVGAEKVIQRRGRILQFPVEFGALRRPLARLVEELFRPSQYAETPLLRGFYFSSGAQVGNPVDRVLAGGLGRDGLSRHAGLSPPGGSGRGGQGTSFEQQAGGGASFFVTDLLRKIIFPDRRLGTTSKLRVQRHMRQQLLLGAALLVLTAAIVLPAATSYLDNLDLLDATADDVKATRLSAAEPLGGEAALGALDRLLARLDLLDQASAQSSIRYLWGPYTAPPVRDALRGLYLERLRKTAEGPLRQQLSASVRSVGDLPNLDPESFTAGYDALHLYLMLADPVRLDPEWATSELARVWAQASQRGALGGGSVASHVDHYVKQLAVEPSWAWPEDGILVERARGRLASMPVDVIAYSTLEAAAKGAPPIRPDQIFVGAAVRFLTTKGKVEVPGLYTRLGWEKVRPLLEEDKEMHFASWVLGQGSGNGEAAWSVEQLRSQYFERYERAWYDFFLGLNIATPSTLRGAIDELSALGKVDGPYVRLFRRFADNVRLEFPPKTLLEKIATKVEDKLEKKVEKLTKEQIPDEPERKITPVERDFSRLRGFAFGDTPPSKDTPQNDLPPAPLSQYLDQLRTLEVSLKQIEQASVEPGAQFREELGRTAASVERLLAGLTQQERLIIEPLLMNPIRGSQSAVDGAQGAQLNDRWRSEVWEPYRRMVSRYPFVAGSAYEVPLADFAEFFRPNNGTLWAFYEETLAGRLLRSGSRFAARPSEARSGFRSDFFACLASAQNITDGVFRGDTTTPNVSFGVKMQAVGAEVSEITLRIDGQALVYRNEPERWQSMQWPGKDGPPGAAVQVRGANFKDEIRRQGEFAFIRLLTEGGVKPVAPGAVDLEASWDLNKGVRVTIQFRPPASRHPFQKGFFSTLQCPPAVISGSLTGSRAEGN